jgi:membrane fusion protein (multidrug efflux system)
VQAGRVHVELDVRQETAQLAAAAAQRDLARLTNDRLAGLHTKGVVSQAEADVAAAELRRAEAVVGEIEAAIERKTIRAPFAGILGIRQVDLGQYLAGGDPVVELQSLDPIHVDFAAPQHEVANLTVDDAVSVALEGAPDVDFVGTITALDSIVDDATRTVRVQATLDNLERKLRPGMFVEVHVERGAGASVIALPASAISYAPYGDSVFVVEDLQGPDGNSYRGARQQFVKLGGARGDQVAVLEGLTAGQEVVSSGVFKLRSGAAVLVDNEIQPGNDPTPEPEDS